MNGRRRGYRMGDHLLVDDLTGETIRSSRAVKQWDGSITRRDHAINLTRHPQEFQKIVNEKQSVPDARPRTADVFIGPLSTTVDEAAAAGVRLLNLTASARFEAGDTIGIMLANMDHWRTTIFAVWSRYIGVPDPAFSEYAFSEAAEVTVRYNVLELSQPLPWAVDFGALVVNYSAVALSDLAA